MLHVKNSVRLQPTALASVVGRGACTPNAHQAYVHSPCASSFSVRSDHRTITSHPQRNLINSVNNPSKPYSVRYAAKNVHIRRFSSEASVEPAPTPISPSPFTPPKLRLSSSVFVAPHPLKRNDPSAVPLATEAPLSPLLHHVTPDGVVVFRSLPEADVFECVRRATVIGYIDKQQHTVLAHAPTAEALSKAIAGETDLSISSPNTQPLPTDASFTQDTSAATSSPFPPPAPRNPCDVGGEDAYVVLSGRARPAAAGSRPYSMVAIADGVSSWRYTHGVDSGLFARALVAHARDAGVVAAGEGDCSSARVFWSAVDGCLRDGVVGSATLTVGTLCERAGKTMLDFTRVGDCGVIVLRPRRHLGRRFFEVVYRSRAQVLALDTPVQVSCVHAQAPTQADAQAVVDAAEEEVDADAGMVVDQAAEDAIRAVYPSFRHTGTLVAVGDAPASAADAEHPRLAMSASSDAASDAADNTEMADAVAVPFRAVHNTTVAPVQTQQTLPPVAELSARYPAVRPLRARVRVEEGDVVVWGSDGLFDNVFDGDLVKTVTECANAYYARHLSRGSEAGLAELVAARVGDLCVERSLDRRTSTPYAAAAQDDFVLWHGGRLDDVCIVVSVVNKPSDVW